MFGYLFFSLAKLGNSYAYHDMTVDTLEAEVDIINDETFNNVNCKTLVLRGTTQLLSLSGITNLQVVELPSTLTNISTTGFGPLTDLEFRMPTGNENFKIQDDMLLYSPDGLFNPLRRNSTYIIKYFGQRDVVKINFSCTIVENAFNIDKFYVNKLELGDIEYNNSRITLREQGHKFPALAFYYYQLLRTDKSEYQCDRLYISTASYWPYTNYNGTVFFFNPFDEPNSPYRILDIPWVHRKFSKIESIGISDGIYDFKETFRVIPKLKIVYFEGKTQVNLYADLFAATNIEKLDFSKSYLKFKQAFLSGVERPVPIVPPLHSNVFPSFVYSRAIVPQPFVTREDIDTIGDSCFYGCDFTTITLPSHIKKLQRLVFSQCHNLVSIDLSTITEIGMYCFSVCPGLTEFTFSHKIKIGKSCFYNCHNLATVSFMNNEIEFGDAMFENCLALTTVNFAEGTKKLPREMFSGCTKLLTLNLPDSISELGNRCFHNLLFEEFKIPDSVESIGFIGVLPLLKKIYITKSSKLSEIRDLFGWANCQDKAQLSFPSIETISLTKNKNFVVYYNYLYTKDYQTMVVSLPGNDQKTTMFSPTTKYVMPFAFFNNPNLVNLVFSDIYNTKIARFAFFNMTELKIVKLPHNVSLSRETFVWTDNITQLCYVNNDEHYIETIRASGAPPDSIGNGCDTLEVDIPEVPYPIIINGSNKIETMQRMEKSVDPFKVALAAIYYV